MKNSISRKQASELIASINLPQLIKNKMEQNDTNHMRLSLDTGHNRGYLYHLLKHSDQSASVLVALSHHLQTNLFEPYINLLPEEIRVTQREKDLQAQIASLQEQIDNLSKERDIYKGIAMK